MDFRKLQKSLKYEAFFHGEVPEVFFRTKESVIIPYIKNKVTSWDFVKKITIGPINQCDIAENGVKAILNYKDIKADVVKSEIPIRF